MIRELLVVGLLAASAAMAEPMDASRMPRYGQWRSSMIGGGGYIQNVVFSADPSRLYAYVDVAGAFRSDDGGKSWRMLHGHLPNRDGANEVRGLLADPRDANRILLACGNHWAKSPMGIFLSEDGGETFRQMLVARFGGNAEYRTDGVVLAREAANPDTLLAGSLGDGMYRSSDGGRGWKLAGENTRGICFTDVKFGRSDSSKAWACALKFKNTIDGKPAPLAGGFFTSKDGGASWTRLSDESPAEIEQDPRSARLYGLFRDGVAVRVSDDGGASWVAYDEGLKNAAGGAFRCSAIAAGPDFMVLCDSTGEVYRLNSGEKRWKHVRREGVDYRGWTIANRADIPVMFGQGPGSIIIDPRNADHLFVTDAFGLFESADAGRNWTLRVDGLETTVIHCIAQDPSDPGRVHMGMADSGYFLSTDGASSLALKRLCSNVKDVAISPKLPARVYATVHGEGKAWFGNLRVASSPAIFP